MSIFCSRNSFYKSVTGAVAEGTTLRLRLSLPSPCVREAFTVLRRDGGEPEHIPMECIGVFWECEITFSERGLWFYRFEYRNHGSDFLFVLTKGEFGEAVPSDSLPDWQQTVYSADIVAPSSLGKGIIYQIFPDRFCSSGSPKAGVPDDRYIHPTFDSPLAFEGEPREDGYFLNNDYYGGDLKGITSKLGYIASLGATAIYLNPIFEAHSNHRYNTADYKRIDPLLGDEDDFVTLCREAKKLGISVIIDGVFSHTGSDSVYFNREGRYPDCGAWQSSSSPYSDWYNIGRNGEYRSWWGIDTLPEVKEESSFLEFICGEDGVLHKWLSLGASGVRLDVADELPDRFLDAVYSRVKKESPDNTVIAEVWEDASNKSSYGRRRRYLLGGQTDSVMNYPLKDAIISFVTGSDAEGLRETEETLLENYPPEVTRRLMNHLGSHDTARILTALGGEPVMGRGREWQSRQKMSDAELKNAKRLLRLAAALQYTLPGVPSLYYGDEAGMTGYSDPFNRGFYPWGSEDEELLGLYRMLGRIKINISALDGGSFANVYSSRGVFSFVREDANGRLYVAVNRSELPFECILPEGFEGAELLCGHPAVTPPYDFTILYKRNDK